MFFRKRKRYQSLEDLVQDLRSEGNYEQAGAYIFAIAKAQYELKKNRINYLEEHILEDVFQEAILQTIQQIKNGDLENFNTLGAYFYAIFRNKCVDIHRKKLSRERREGKIISMDLDYFPEMGEEAYDAVQQEILNEKEQKELFTWLHKNHPDCLQLYRLRYIWNMTIEEIRKEVNSTSAASIRSRISKCRKKIKTEFKSKK